MGTPANIVVGLQATNTVKIGSYGALEAAAVDIGFIDGGIKIEKDETQYEVKVDQALATIRKVTTNSSLKFSFSMAEATLANMAIAFGMATTAVSSDTISFGVPTTDEEKTVYINVKGPGPGTCKLTFWKVRPTGKVSPAYKKDDKTLFDVEFEALYDTTQSAGQEFGKAVMTGSDTTPPTIAMTTPAEGGTRTAGGKTTVVLTLTEANPLNQNSIIYGSTVAINKQGTPDTLLAGSIVYDSTAKTITFTPTENWSAGTYSVIVTTGLTDAAGNHLAAPYITYLTVN